MRKVSAIDSFFLDSETPQATMNIGGLTLLDPSTAGGRPLRYDELLAYLRARLHLAPNLRRRLVFHPFGLDEPRLVDDPHFDLEFHVRHLALPQPADWQQLKTLTARLLAQPMDLQRPLWEFYLIEGLQNLDGVPPNAYAFFIKLHHAVFDGGAVGATLWAFMQDTPEQVPPPPDKAWVPDPTPALQDWMSTALPDGMRQWMEGVGALTGVGMNLATTLQGKMAQSVGQMPAPPVLAPKTRFQQRVTSHRVWDFVSLPMAELQAVRAALGKPKMNDLLLAVVGGALRRYLAHHGELPDAPLQALCPINVREGSPIEGGNHLSAMRVALGTDIAAPLERLAAITQASAAAKGTAQALGNDFMADLMSLNPYAVRTRMIGGIDVLMERLGVNGPPIANTVISNAPPPKGGHYFAGSRVITAPAFGPLFHHCALLHAITGLDFESTIAVTSCREFMPDIGFYMDCIRGSFQEFKRVAAMPAGTEPASLAETAHGGTKVARKVRIRRSM